MPAPAQAHAQLVVLVQVFHLPHKVVTGSPVLVQVVGDDLRQQDARRLVELRVVAVRVSRQLDLGLQYVVLLFLFRGNYRL